MEKTGYKFAFEWQDWSKQLGGSHFPLASMEKALPWIIKGRLEVHVFIPEIRIIIFKHVAWILNVLPSFLGILNFTNLYVDAVLSVAS